jgi:hypothetical protein
MNFAPLPVRRLSQTQFLPFNSPVVKPKPLTGEGQ